MTRQHQAEQQYREAIRRIGQRWKGLPPGQRVSEVLAKLRHDELIQMLLEYGAREREECARIVDRYRTEYAQNSDVTAALSELADRIRVSAK